MKRILLLSVIFVVSLTACNQRKETIRIGYIGPLTGEAASFGADVFNGARIAVDTMNVDGGIHGKKVELIAEDGRCNGSDAENAAQKLINIDHVVAIIGGLCDEESSAIIPVTEKDGIVFLSLNRSNEERKNVGEHVFSVQTQASVKDVSPKLKNFQLIFRQRYDEPQQSYQFSILGYDAMNIIAGAIRSGGVEEMKSSMDAMKTFEGLSGALDVR